MQKFIEQCRDREIVPLLCDYIRIPARSPTFDPDWERSGHIERARRVTRCVAEVLAARGRRSPD